MYFPTLKEHAVAVGINLLALGLLDVIVARQFFSKGRWLFIHAMANFAVTVFSARDSLTAFLDPASSCLGDYSLIPVQIIAALHLYHLIAFRNLSTDEWVHHLLFGGIISGVGMTYRSGPLQNLVALFICGLPGGVDYLLLVCVKYGFVKKLDEKKYNARINVWLRSPGLMLCAAFMYVAMIYGQEESTCSKNKFKTALTAALIFLNGQYYMRLSSVTHSARMKNITLKTFDRLCVKIAHHYVINVSELD